MPTLDTLAESFRRHLLADQKSPNTVRRYLTAIQALRLSLEKRGEPTEIERITRDDIRTLLADRAPTVTPSTLNGDFRALRVFFRWCVDEDEIEKSPMDRLHQPRIPETPPPIYSERELVKIIGACEGKRFIDKRDMVIIRLLVDCGMRRSELAYLRVEAVDLDQQLLRVVGKGRRERIVPFGNKSAISLDRYLRARDKHPLHGHPQLLLGQMGPLTDNGLYQAIRERAKKVGVDTTGHAVHRFRHTWAHRWLSEGGQEGDAMRIAGWRSRSLLDRYGASAATDRAIKAHRDRSPGDHLNER
jgi:site-specific recombinase XerD